MWTIAVLASAGFLITFLLSVTSFMKSKDYDDIALGFMLSLFFGLLGLGLGGLLALGIGWTLPTKNIVAGQTQLVALRDKTVTEGSFFLGSGSVNGNPYYCFYYRDNDGLIRMGRVPTDRAFIKESDTKEAVIDIHETVFTKEWMSRLAVMVDSDRYYVFVVPTGTVIRQYRLDLQ